MGMSATAVVVYVLLSVTSLSAQSSIAELKMKADSGDVRAKVSLAHAYEKGEGVLQSQELAAKWYLAAAQQGDPEAQNSLGVLYRLGRGVEQDKTTAVEWYRKAAKQGYGPAMFNLGTACYNGDGVEVDDRLAYAWFALAERAGSKEAAAARQRTENEFSPEKLAGSKLVMAKLVLHGEGVLPDPAFAFSIVKSVAATKDPGGLAELGVMYAEGVGTNRAPELAVKYLKESGRPDAQDYLAMMYLEGRGIPRDTKKGIAILSKLAEFNTRYKLKLADMYWDGKVLPQDYKAAVKDYELLAADGNGHALYRLGMASRDGLSAKKDAETACMYFVIGNSLGDKDAGDAAASVCTADILDRAKKKASTWLQKQPRARFAVQNRRGSTPIAQ